MTDRGVLPPGMAVIERGWLNANHVLFRENDNDGAVLIDSAYVTHADTTLALLRQPDFLGQRPLARVLNTHCHSDHMGGNARLQQQYAAKVWIPAAEVAHIAQWDQAALWLDVAGQSAEPFRVDGLLWPGKTLLLGQTEWHLLAAPGHRMEALMFYSPEYRLLISGDALWENGLGAVLPDDDLAGLHAALATLDLIETLPLDWVIPGHGSPFTDVPQALARARKRLQAMRADPQRWAIGLLKSLLMFNLLEQQSMPLARLPAYLETLPLFRNFSQTLLRQSPAQLAERVVLELESSRVLRREAGQVVPLIPA